jgi:hypothetical protein
VVLSYLNKRQKWNTYPAFPDPTTRFFIGLDVGQRRDPSAIAVIARTETTYNDRDPVTYAFRKEVTTSLAYLERIPLGTEYHDVVARVRSVAQMPDLLGRCSGVYGVPKRDLITRLQLMFECGELRVSAELREASVFVEELRNMRVKVSLGGHETFEHWRSGQHDDLVLAVALACWQAKRWRDISGRVRLF